MNFATSALILATLGLTTNLQAKDWPQWRGPDRTGLSTETGIIKDWQKTPPKLLWNMEGAGKGFSSVSIADGVIYTTGNFKNG